MGLWNNFFGSKAEQVEEVRQTTNEDVLLQALVGGSKVTKEDALNIPSLAACVDLISDTVASLPIKLYKENGKSVEEVKDNRVVLLNDETKDTLDGYQFKKALVTDYLLDGAGYAYINRKRNEVASLHYVEKAQVSVMRGIDPIFKSYDIMIMGKKYRDFEFIKLARKTVDGVTGKGIIDEHNKLLSVVYNTLIYEELLVKTGGNKKGFLKAENRLSPEAITELKAAWARLYQNNSENVVVLNNGLEFEEASSTSVEMQLNENKRTNADEIYKIFKLNGNTLDENSIKSAIMPILIAFETALNKDLLLPSEKEQSFYFAFDTKDLLKTSMLERFQAYKIGIETGVLQIDEVRYEENRAPLGLDFIKLGLQDVLYNPKTKEIYTPNTDKTGNIEGGSPVPTEEKDALEGGE